MSLKKYNILFTYVKCTLLMHTHQLLLVYDLLCCWVVLQKSDDISSIFVARTYSSLHDCDRQRDAFVVNLSFNLNW